MTRPPSVQRTYFAGPIRLSCLERVLISCSEIMAVDAANTPDDLAAIAEPADNPPL
jgi:hypothetical protein